jgi:hypothetical protein
VASIVSRHLAAAVKIWGSMVTRSSSHPIPGRLRCAAPLASAWVLFAGCRLAGPNDLDVGVSPRYACPGDSVTITFSVQDVDRIEIIDGRGRTLVPSTDRNGAATVKKVQPTMLPFTATGWKGLRSRSVRVPGDIPFAMIDGTINTESFPLDRPQWGPEVRTRIGTHDCGCTLDDDGAPLVCENTASIYDVSRALTGYEGALDRAWFSPRAHVVGLVNDTAWPLAYSHNGNRIFSVPNGGSQAIDFASEVVPSGTWAVGFEGQTVPVPYLGTYVDGGEVCSGWVHRRPDRAMRPVDVKLSLRCME